MSSDSDSITCYSDTANEGDDDYNVNVADDDESVTVESFSLMASPARKVTTEDSLDENIPDSTEKLKMGKKIHTYKCRKCSRIKCKEERLFEAKGKGVFRLSYNTTDGTLKSRGYTHICEATPKKPKKISACTTLSKEDNNLLDKTLVS